MRVDVRADGAPTFLHPHKIASAGTAGSGSYPFPARGNHRNVERGSLGSDHTQKRCAFRTVLVVPLAASPRDVVDWLAETAFAAPVAADLSISNTRRPRGKQSARVADLDPSGSRRASPRECSDRREAEARQPQSAALLVVRSSSALEVGWRYRLDRIRCLLVRPTGASTSLCHVVTRARLVAASLPTTARHPDEEWPGQAARRSWSRAKRRALSVARRACR
jgi:hypothetical protein